MEGDRVHQDEENPRPVGQRQSAHGLPLLVGKDVGKGKPKTEEGGENTMGLQLEEEEKVEEVQDGTKGQDEKKVQEGTGGEDLEKEQEGPEGLQLEEEEGEEEVQNFAGILQLNQELEEEFDGVGEPEDVPLQGRPERIRRPPLMLNYDTLGNPNWERKE
jgi:hypothetical protein